MCFAGITNPLQSTCQEAVSESSQYTVPCSPPCSVTKTEMMYFSCINRLLQAEQHRSSLPAFRLSPCLLWGRACGESVKGMLEGLAGQIFQVLHAER